MKGHPILGFKVILVSFALLSVALVSCGGGGGDAGPAGPSGSSSGTVSGTVNNSLSASPVANVAVTTSPAVQGVSNISTDASGNYSMSLPTGNYTLTFTKTNFTTQTATVSVAAAQTTSKNISLVPVGAAVVNAGADLTGKATGGSVGLSASLEIYDPSLTGKPVTYSWSQTSGPTASISGGTTATPTVTLASRSDAKTKLVLNNANRQGVSGSDTPTMNPLERFMVQPINSLSLEEAEASVFKVTATVNGQSFTDEVKVSMTLPFVTSTGLRNVPIGQTVVLHGKTQGSYNWSISSKPAGSTAELNDANSQNPDFMPDVAGKYTITESTGAASLDIFAGTWVGVIKPDGTPDNGCLSCHNGTEAPDKFTPWKTTGHATIMTNNINDPAGYWSKTSCAPCHTVGFKQYATAIPNGGWDQVSTAEGFSFTQGASAWSNTLLNYPKTAQLSNIQCENCHGPQSGGGAHTTGSPRVDPSSGVCGTCHGEPARHGRYQEWAESGHGDFKTAVDEGWSATANGGAGGINPSCGGCHTAQGFLQWYKQLANDGGARKVGSRTLDATSLAKLATIKKDQLQPQTCAACHDPHDEGTTTGKTSDAKVRVTGNTSLLPGGFIASGVGRGAVCITCHNSRNGELVSGAGNATLHEDGDANWSTQVSSTANGYASPHEAAQGDVMMGRNAYYVTGSRAKHSFIADTCATCHMELTNPPDEYSGGGANGSNHGFKASFDICTKCHGSFTGGTVQSSFDAKLAELNTEIGKATYRLANGGSNPPAGTSIVITYGRSPKISVGGAAAVSFTTYLTGAPGTTSGYHADIAKANWNYTLVSADSSKGIHNSTFVFQVLDATIAKMKTL